MITFPVYLVDENIQLILPEINSANNANNGVRLEENLATYARSLDGAEDNSELSERTLDYIRQETTRYIQTRAEGALGQYGTAKVNVNFDADFKLESGEVDLLLPFASYSEGDQPLPGLYSQVPSLIMIPTITVVTLLTSVWVIGE